MGGYLIVGTEGNLEKLTIEKNARFSTGTMENGIFKARRISYSNSSGNVTMANGTTHALSRGHVNALFTIAGDKNITESDLLILSKKPKGQIKKVTQKGNGVYIVEYQVQGVGRADNKDTAYMEFDFETEQERAAREAAEKQKADAAKNQKSVQPQKDTQPEEKSWLRKKLEEWFF